MASHKELKARQRRERHTHSPSVALQVHRALSWLGRAEKERVDDDARFVFLWIAFNAAYATEGHDSEMTEERSFKSFLRTLIKLGRDNCNSHLARKQFSENIRVVLVNKHVFFHC